jgi:hypothetical protein
MNKLSEGIPPSEDDYEFDAVCNCCKKDFKAQGLVGGETICHICYPIWFQGIMTERNAKEEQIAHMYSQEEMDERSCEIIKLEESNYAYIQLLKSLEEEKEELKKACKLYDLTKCGDCGQYAECMYAEKSLGICSPCWEDNHT